jgi:integrase
MAQSRKDSRGYALRIGECQRSDGRYSYSYVDKDRKRQVVYAPDLITLRKKEQQIRRDLEDGLDPRRAERVTVNQVYDSYIKGKYDLKATTKANYIYTYDHFIRETFGRRKLIDVKYSDVKKFYYTLLTEKELAPATVDNVHTQLHPAFQMAVRDGYIRTNPCSGVLGEIKKSHVWVTEKRMALTVPEQKAFMNYLFTNHKYQGWKPLITVLIGTGLRIGECLGLRWEDLDFENRTIDVNHNLVHRRVDEEGGTLHINTPKTKAGCRTVPMIQQVYDAFLEEYQLQQLTGFCTQEVEGYSGFVFASSNGTVTLPVEVNRAIHSLIDDYNEEEKANARKEGRNALILPRISAHHLRHTFCTRLCETETNVKVIQTIMGHKDIQTTLDIYADCTEEKKKEVIHNIEDKIFIL